MRRLSNFVALQSLLDNYSNYLETFQRRMIGETVLIGIYHDPFFWLEPQAEYHHHVINYQGGEV